MKHVLPTLMIVAAIAVNVQACAPGIPPEALRLSAESLQQRQLQTRRFETDNESILLAASAGVLQDLGFNIENSETNVGLIFGSKDRDAIEPVRWQEKWLWRFSSA